MAPALTIRSASVASDDGLLILKFVDSQIPWLKKVGSGAQWGNDLVSTDKEMLQKYRQKISLSEASASKPFGKDWCRVFIADVAVTRETASSDVRALVSRADHTDGILSVPVAAMILQGHSVDYVRPILPEQDDKDPFVFLQWLVTDRRTATLSQGAGERLMDFMRDEARNLGVKRICCDCWRGNDRRLVKYYERYGFTSIGDFCIEQDSWPGTVLEMRI